MRELGMATATTVQEKWAASASMRSVLGATFFFDHSARLRTDDYSILESFADYKPDVEIPAVFARRVSEFRLKLFLALHYIILGTFMEENTSTSNAHCDQ